jgi:ribonuclease T2
MRRLVLAAAAAVSLAVAAGSAGAQQADGPAAYESLVLSLSWSPTWCASRSGQSDEEQCGAKKYGFVVHGLWPQYARGVKHPKCLTATEVPAKVADQAAAVMPSHKLIEHEWEKHGACVDKDPAAYFAKAKAAYDRIKLPTAFRSSDQARTMTADQIRKAFVDANSGLPADAVAVACHMPRKTPGQTTTAPPPATADLNDVRFCLDRDLKFRSCPGAVRDRCPDGVVVPAAKK